MRRYKYEIKTVLGDTDYLIVEGNTDKDAISQIQTKRFIQDLKSVSMYNTEHIVTIKSLGEDKVEVES